MKKINLITLSLSASLTILCSSLSALAMDVFVEKEDLSSDLQPKTRSNFIELIEEKIANQQKISELYSQPNNSDMSSLIAVLMFEGDKSSSEFEELKRKCVEASQKQQETSNQGELLTQRDTEIDKILPHALLDWYRDRMTKSPVSGENYNSPGKPFLGEGVMIGDHKIISVPDCLQTKASQSAYTRTDPLTGLRYRMELLTDQNIKWYTERVGLEALMAFWNPLLKDLQEKLPYLTSTFSDTSLEIRMRQAFDNPESFDSGNEPTIKQLNFNEMMAMGTKNFDSLPLPFQEACQKYNLSETQVRDFLGALRGFEMNLRDYKNVPTWVAFASSEKIDNIQDIDPMSPIIKIMMTSTEGGPFYDPLGILRSRIALAFDETSYPPLSIPLHSFVASTMRGFDPGNPNNNKWMITRPLPPMQKIFKLSGVPFTESFGYKFSGSYPSILRPGNYEDQNGKSIQFHDDQRYAAYVIFDPETKENYQIGRNHPFVQNYYLGGISGRDMKLPFVMINSDDLVKVHKWDS